MDERDRNLTTDELASAWSDEDGARDTRTAQETATSGPAGAASSEPLLAADEAGSFSQRWERTQHRFVDEPRQAVEEADQLVAELMRHLAQVFAREREGLEEQWGRGSEASTEDLRVALQRYRSFFQRLLAT